MTLAAAAALLAVLVPMAEPPTVHAQLGGSAEPGMIVALDSGNGRFQAFYPDGTFAFQFAAGRDVNSIDVGPDGMIIVSRHYDVEAYHPNGTYAFRVAEHGHGVGSVRTGPEAAVAPDGRIVVAGNHRIQVFDPDGTFASVFGLHRDVVVSDRALSWVVIAVDIAPDGRIVVLDGAQQSGSHDRNYVRIFHLNGTPALSFPVGHSHFPALDLAVAPDGRIVVVASSDYGERSYVSVYRPLPNGTFSYTFLNGTSNQPLPNGTLVAVPGIEAVQRPGTLAVGADGRIVVGGGNRISVFHSNGSLALNFGGYGSVKGGFDRPTDAAVGSDGRIVVAEPGNRTISVFHPNGTPAFSFGSYGHGDDAFYTPRYVAVGPDGKIVVGDAGKQRILVFNSDGTPSFAFGAAGSGAGELRTLRGVAVAPNGSIVVVDSDRYGGYARVQVFNPDGAFVSELASAGHPVYFGNEPSRAAVGPDGRIVVSGAAVGGGVRVFEPNGTEAFAIGLEGDEVNGVAVGPDGRIVVVQGSRSQVFSPDGEFVFATEIDVDAVSVAVGPDGEIVVVDDRDDRVQVFSPNGTFAFSLLPDLSEGKFNGVGAIAVGPLMPRTVVDPGPLWAAIGREGGGDGGAPILRNFTNVGDAANVTIDLAGLVGPGGADALNGSESSTVTFPASETVVAASFAEVSFPPNVTASHVPAGGRLALRVAANVPAAEQVQAALGRDGGAEVIVLLQRVVEVGAEEGPRIMFDLPIRIALEGQNGGRAFYIEGANGTIVPIDGACAADGVDAVHRQLGGAGECQMDSADGTAKIVYTYHLTKFGTVSIEGPVPGRIDAVDPPATPPPTQPIVPPPQPQPQPQQPDGGGGQPDVVPPPQQPDGGGGQLAVDMCAISIAEPALDMSVRPGEYSDPVEQVVINSGTLPLARVEIKATPWHDGSGPPTPPPLPGVPPPYSGPTEGRTAGAFTAYMIASLPASVTEVREGGDRIVDGAFVAGEYEALADGGSGTAVLEGLEPSTAVDLLFRLNLTPYDGLLAGALVQSVTYQAECVQPTAPPASAP